MFSVPHHYNRTNASWKGETPKIPLGRIIEWRQLANQLKQANADQPKTHADLVKANLSKETIQLIPKNDEAPSQAFQIKIYEDLKGMIGDATLTSIARENELELPDYAMNWLTRPDDLMTEEEKQSHWCHNDVIHESPPRNQAKGPCQSCSQNRLDPMFWTVINGRGRRRQFHHQRYPWFAWSAPPLLLPLVVTVCLSATGLALVVHRQWSTHEHLRIRLSIHQNVASEPGRVLSPFHNKLFCWDDTCSGHPLNNFAYACWEQLIKSRSDSTLVFLKLVPHTRSGIGNWDLFNPTIYFTVIDSPISTQGHPPSLDLPFRTAPQACHVWHPRDRQHTNDHPSAT